MRQVPCVLAIGGLDPGGGAGILADARAIERAGAFACAVATVLTVQSTRGLARAVPVAPKLWVEQARRVLADQNVRAIKIGALGSAENVRAAAKVIIAGRRPVVLDPVMLPTRGRARLLDEDALAAMRRLLQRAALVTANVAEAESLTGLSVRNLADAKAAARALVAMGAGAALVKGGHLERRDATDVLAVGAKLHELSASRLEIRRGVHGTGCYLASLVAARLAFSPDVARAVRWAKRIHHAQLAHATDVGADALVLAF
ncbi:MAG TPA: hydroxymethylpyrimidine/phosphomethylpyrimidine kinase [Polyangiaceae bacterium]|jgi:hydroxymethylpyrimidine/phosphomethylpyrimidine kinase